MHNLQPSSPFTGSSVSKFGFFDNKLETIFLQPKETYELPRQCPAFPHLLASIRLNRPYVQVLLPQGQQS